MKKNVMMRLAAILLVCVLASTCGISGTYAKYVTEGTGMDNARVAHWGVKITPNGAMFEKLYGKDDATYTLDDNTVISSDEWKLVAPGTTHGMTEIVLEGSPEVATRVTYEATVVMGPWKLSDGTTEYCPVYFTIEGKTYGIAADCGKDDLDFAYTTVAELVAGIKDAIENCKKDYVANKDLSTVSADYPSVSWTWPYHTTDANDVKDTDLGNLAADGYHSVIQIEIKTIITQIN